MPQSQHHTFPPRPQPLQAVIDEGWEQEVLPQLPRDYEQQAEQLKAFVRQREIKQVADLLRALLASVLCAPSFRQVGAWAVLVGLANISHVAWRKRLRQAHAWLLWRLERTARGERSSIHEPARAACSASCFSMPRGSNSPVAVETTGGCIWAMSGTGGRLVGVRVADRHRAEGFELFLIAPGDIVVGDRG